MFLRYEILEKLVTFIQLASLLQPLGNLIYLTLFCQYFKFFYVGIPYRFLFLRTSNACISIQLNWLMFTITVRWHHLLKPIIWIEYPSSPFFHLLSLSISYRQVSMGTSLNRWDPKIQDLNPRPLDLRHDAWDHRTTVSS